MLKRLSFLFFVLGFTAWLFGGDYTVVLKNGKTMKGSLVSETADTVIFKDSSGVQYSLKKANLDLAKMTELNQPPKQETVPQAQTNQTETPKKPAKTYTAEDIEKLREKYGESAISGSGGGAEAVEMTPAEYLKELQGAASMLSDVTQTVGNFGNQLTSIAGVAQAKGTDPSETYTKFISGIATRSIMDQADRALEDIEKKKGELSAPPEGLETAYTSFTTAFDYATDYYADIKATNISEDGLAFMDKMTNLLDPVKNAQLPAKAPEEEEQATQEKKAPETPEAGNEEGEEGQ